MALALAHSHCLRAKALKLFRWHGHAVRHCRRGHRKSRRRQHRRHAPAKRNLGRLALGHSWIRRFEARDGAPCSRWKAGFEADTGSMTNNGSLYWCRANDAPATAPAVCPGVVFVTTPPASQVPAAAQPTVVGGSNAVNNSLLQAITTVNAVGAIFDRQAWGGLVTPCRRLFPRPPVHARLRDLEQVQRDRRPDRVAVRAGVYQPHDPRQQFAAVSNRVARIYRGGDVRLWRLRDAAE